MAEEQVDFGNVIKQKLAESMQNMDVLSMLQTVVQVSPDDEEGEHIQSKLKGVLDQYNVMTDEQKAYFTEQMKQMLSARLTEKLGKHDFKLDGLQDAISQAIMWRLAILGVGVLIFVVLLVFFGYKLYKSIKDKEIKKEEKKKAKQMKKKK